MQQGEIAAPAIRPSSLQRVRSRRRSILMNWRNLSTIVPSGHTGEVEDPEWVQIRQLCGNVDDRQHQHQEFVVQSYSAKHSVLLNFNDDSDFIQYRIFQRKTLLYPPLIPVLCLVVALDWISFSYGQSFVSGPYYCAAFILFVVTNILFLPLFFSECILSLKEGKGDGDSLFNCAKFIFLAFGGELESISCFLFALKFGMYLMAVVHEGQCFGAYGKSFGGDSPNCKIKLKDISRSIEEVLKIGAFIVLTFLIPVGFQVCFKRVSRWAMLLSWVASTTFAVIAVQELPGSAKLLGFVCPFSLIFLVISYENERFKISAFLQTRAISQNEFLKQEIVRQRASYALETERARHKNDMYLIDIQMQKEQSEKEQGYLRNLIGNVAHDLKTPLQSMAMGLETMLQALDDNILGVSNHISSNIINSFGPRPRSSSGRPKEEQEQQQQQSKAAEADAENHTGTGGFPSSTPSISNTSGISSLKDGHGGSEVQRLSGAQSLPIIRFQPAPPAVYSSYTPDAMAVKSSDKKLAAFSEIIPSLQASCSFMEMAINRALDFTKASNNIALVPKVEVFSLSEAIQKPVSSVIHLQSAGSSIIVEPLPRTISERIVSDKHWMCENILCLLSNAVKYSTGRPVRITVDLIPVMVSQMTIVPLQRAISVKSDWMSLNGSSVSSPAASSSIGNSRRTSARGKPSLIRVIVEDSGPGLSDKEQDKLFQSLNQGERRSGGAGLGLYSLSKRLDALGGSYGVTSRADGKSGCAFWFAFPYEAAPTDLVVHKSVSLRATLPSLDEEKMTLHMSPAAVHLADPNASLRILIVDDAMTILKITKMTLQKKGYYVETANNGAIGLEKMIKSCDAWLKREASRRQTSAGSIAAGTNAAPPPTSMAATADGLSDEIDVVLMDLQMPVMDGFEAVRRFREYETECKNNHAIECKRKLQNVSDRHNSTDLHHHRNSTAVGGGAGAGSGPNGSGSGSAGEKTAGGSEVEGGKSSGTGTLAGFSSLLIIGMSANSDDVSREEAKKAGMDFFLEKPFTISDFEHLLETIRAAFANSVCDSQLTTPMQHAPSSKVLEVITE